MRKNVRSAAVGLDEAETLCIVEPFHSASRHVVSLDIPLITSVQCLGFAGSVSTNLGTKVQILDKSNAAVHAGCRDRAIARRPVADAGLKAEASQVDKIGDMASKPPLPPPLPTRQRPKEDDGGSLVLERLTQKTKPPQMYQVVMLNDDFTPMEFVVVVIQEFFNKDRETATQIMLKIHLDGKAVCGVYSRDVAATKVEQVQSAARQAGHPLQCVSEPVE